MALNSQALVDAIVSHALALGVCERVNAYEPKSAPGNGITAAVWVQQIQPVARLSGLAITSARVEFTVRLYTNMLKDPQEDIDPALMGAVDLLMAAYSADFTLGGLVHSVDLLGAHGEPLFARAGYLSQDNRLYRVFDLTLPLVIADCWEQVS